MKKIEFYKYHGLENDFVVIDSGRSRIAGKLKPQLVADICHRNRGVGADGVIFLSRKRGKFFMGLFNADGSEAETSGNGLRIAAQHLYRQKLAENRQFSIYNIVGENRVRVISTKGSQQLTEIAMSQPRFELKSVPMKGKSRHFVNSLFKVDSGALLGTAVNVGNPHIVFFVDNTDFDWQTFGVEVETDKRFPEGTNVEFAIVKSRKHVIHWSWERGVGPTRSSGTGAASTAAAGMINGLLDHKVRVTEPAGDLEIEIPSLESEIMLTGPSEMVCQGTYSFSFSE